VVVVECWSGGGTVVSRIPLSLERFASGPNAAWLSLAKKSSAKKFWVKET